MGDQFGLYVQDPLAGLTWPSGNRAGTGIRGPGRLCRFVWRVRAIPGRIVDQASGSHHMSAERTKPVAATMKSREVV